MTFSIFSNPVSDQIIMAYSILSNSFFPSTVVALQSFNGIEFKGQFSLIPRITYLH